METQKEKEILIEIQQGINEVKEKFGDGKVVVFIGDSEVKGYQLIMDKKRLNCG